jgi:hypothetical protein
MMAPARCAGARSAGIDAAATTAASTGWTSASAGTTCCRSDSIPKFCWRVFHVALPDGRVVSGPPAFAALWLRYPGLRWAGWLARIPPLPLLLEGVYRLFLRLRPRLQRLAGCREACE